MHRMQTFHNALVDYYCLKAHILHFKLVNCEQYKFLDKYTI